MAKPKTRKIATKRHKKPQGGPTSKSLAAKLSQPQFMAVEYHLQGFSRSEAMMKAGYPKTTALAQCTRLFTTPKVAAYLEQRRGDMIKRADNIQDRVKDELAKIAFFNIGNFIAVDEDTGDFIFDFTEAGMDDFAAIGEVTVETYKEGRGDDAQEVKRVRVKPYSKDSALVALARIFGMFNDNITVNDGGVTIEERLARGRKRIEKDAPKTIDADYEEVN